GSLASETARNIVPVMQNDKPTVAKATLAQSADLLRQNEEQNLTKPQGQALAADQTAAVVLGTTTESRFGTAMTLPSGMAQIPRVRTTAESITRKAAGENESRDLTDPGEFVKHLNQSLAVANQIQSKSTMAQPDVRQ